jgi:hypothetical protein
MEKNGELNSGRGARRGCAWNFHRGRERFRGKFEAVYDWNDGQGEGLRGDCRARRGAKLTGMRTAGLGVQIGTKMELRGQEDDSEQQAAKTGTTGVGEHLSTKTKLRPEWLRGQAT